MRRCGACQLCCKIFPLPVLEKPADEWCKFSCAAGCSVYARGQPQVCREYTCYWLDHEEVDDPLRPDRIGMVVTDGGTISVDGDFLRVFMANQSRPEASGGRLARAWIDDLVGRGAVVMVIFGPDMEMLYDRARYPSILPAQIEAAFCHERSRDAAELKRLGAVPDDWRPRTQSEAAEAASRIAAH